MMGFDLAGELRQCVLEPHGNALRGAARIAKDDDAALLLHQSREILHHPLCGPACRRIWFAAQWGHHFDPPLSLDTAFDNGAVAIHSAKEMSQFRKRGCG